jgi:hypothetical protein
MTVKELIAELQQDDPNFEVVVCSDEEFNTVRTGVELATNPQTKTLFIYGLDGSERE